MDHSIFLARVLGFYLVITGLICLMRRAHVQKIMVDFINDRALIFFSGCINVAIGLLIVLSHNVWRADWRVVITLLGYLVLVKGILRMWLDGERVKGRIRQWVARPHLLIYVGVICLIIGIFLVYHGFFS